jgi:hypothetical protein
MERKLILFFITSFVFLNAFSQKPKSGTYTYTIAFAEWQGKSNGASCTVIIKGDSIKIIHNGKATLTGKKGEIIESGIIMQHKKTGRWIIGHSVKDKFIKDFGGCTGGPSEINFKKKIFWLC